MNILIEFYYQNKHYVIYTDDHLDNKTINIKYGIKSENAIFPVEKENEIKLLNEVYKNCLPSKNMKKYIYLYHKRYNGNNYDVYYDKKNDFKIFVPLDNCNVEDMKTLFQAYNSSVYAVDKIFNKDVVKRYIKLLGINTCVYVSTGISLLTFGNKLQNSYVVDNSLNNNVVFEQEYQVSEPQTMLFSPNTADATSGIADASDEEFMAVEKYSFQDIKEWINSNPNLSYQEKEFMLSNPDLYEDNHDENNLDELKETLTTLKISYEEGKSQEYGFKSAGGIYIPNENRIVIFDAKNFEKTKKTILAHEICHAVGGTYGTLGKSILEAINEMIAYEYFNNSFSEKEKGYHAYIPNQSMVRILQDLVGTETIRQCYIYGSLFPIQNVLLEYDSDLQRTMKLFGLADEVFDIDISANSISDSCSAKLAYTEELYDEVKHYYELIKNEKIENDNFAMANLSLCGCNTQIHINGKTILFINSAEGAIFYDKYIKENGEFKIKYLDNQLKNVNYSYEEAIQKGYANWYFENGYKHLNVSVGFTIDRDRIRGQVIEFIDKEYVVNEENRYTNSDEVKDRSLS